MDELTQTVDALKPLHVPFRETRWQARFQEPAQTFDEYLRSKLTRADGVRRVIYIQPIGDFTASQQKILDTTAEFLGQYFNLKVQAREAVPLESIPVRARRVHPNWGMEQLLSTHLLNNVLAPKLPADAAVMIGFTASDLYPKDDWNFVFGQASLQKRVGVWSIYRNGNPDTNAAEYRKCLLRTLKTASHETGHMFSVPHCTLFECNMNGSLDRTEADTQPLHLCPHCTAKICFATGTRPLAHCRKLAEFCKANGLANEVDFYEKSITVLEAISASRR